MDKHLAKIKIIGSLTCFLVLFVIINFWSDISLKNTSHLQHSLSQDITINNAVQIEQLLVAITNSSAILKQKIALHPNDLSHMAMLSNIIITSTPAITCIIYSPNNITALTFPEKLTFKHTGKVILRPLNTTAAQNTLTEFYSIPQLINGQYYIKHHIPVSVDNKHWGYISYQINLNILIGNSHLPLLDESLYSYQLINTQLHNKSTILAQSTAVLGSNFYSSAINIANNNWILNLSFNKQSTDSLFFINTIFSVMLAFVFTLIGYLGISEPSRLRHNLKRLTQQFDEYKLIVNQIMDNVSEEIYISDRNGNIYLHSSNTLNNHHIPPNINLDKQENIIQKNIMFEKNGKTPIHPSEHPINKSLFNDETITQEIVLSPLKTESYAMVLNSRPIFDTSNNNIGALCIGSKIETNNNNNITSNTSRNIILDMLAHNKSIQSIFEHIIFDTQSQLEGVITAITLINTKTQQISSVISKDLPSFYIDSLIGLSIADRVMSNCSAIFHNKLIIAEDINIHPFWVDYKALAQQANLRSCWSQPIHDANNHILGTIDIYSSQVYQTAPSTIILLKEAAILCSLTLERHRDSHRLQKMSLAVQHSSNAVIITDHNGLIEYINPQYTVITGYSPLNKLGTVISIFDQESTPSHIINDINQHLFKAQTWQGEIKGRTKKRGDYWAMVTITPIMSDTNEVNHLVFVLADVTQINQNIKRIDYHNSHDPLTNLYNRQTFEHRLQFLFTKSKEDIRIHSLCVININEYSNIHRKYDYQASDDLLRQVSQILSQQLRKRDTLARIDRDQFYVLMEDCNSISALSTSKELANRVNGVKFYWANKMFDISITVGIREISNQSKSTQLIIQEADIACQQAKEQSDMPVLVFQENSDITPLTDDIFWTEQIKEALEHQQFQLFIQPIINFEQSSSQRYEVLLRLRDDQGNLVSPDLFFPTAIRYNLSIRIDKWVLNKLAQWYTDRPSLIKNIDKFSINLSEDALMDESFSYYLIELASENENLFQHLIFELSEYHLLSNLSHCKRFMDALESTQCQFSIDNFGRGLSTFTHLKDLPITSVKINSELVNATINDTFAEATMRSICHLTQALNINIIATHVETDEVISRLHDFNIKQAQGFLLESPFLLNEIKNKITI